MSVKREADPFIKPDPDSKRVKTEGGDGGFSLCSIPVAPPAAAFASSSGPSAVAPKIENGDRKPLEPSYCNTYILRMEVYHAFGAAAANTPHASTSGPQLRRKPGKDRKKKFGGNSIKVSRGEEWVSAHFNKRTMTVYFNMHCTITKQWSSTEVEKEIFERLNNANFFIQPCENWGFLDRKYNAIWRQATMQPPSLIIDHPLEVKVKYLSTTKVENSPSSFKKEEPKLQPKNERL